VNKNKDKAVNNTPELTDSLTLLDNWGDLAKPESFVGSWGICNMAAIAMRAEPSDAAEMVSQLSYGDVFRVLEADKGCLKIQRWADVDGVESWGSMQGWIDNHLFPAMAVEGKPDVKGARTYTVKHTTDIDKPNAPRLKLPAGCTLRDDKASFGTEEQEFTPDLLFNYIDAYMGAPYLWGGQTSWGTDCSGFVQSVMKCFGVLLPRDSSQQAKIGESVKPEDAPRISLAFYGAAGTDGIGHVGFLYRPDDERYVLIHAKQNVKAQELVTEKGDSFLLYPEGIDKARLKDVRVLDVFKPFSL
jgi:hypothetical protein